MSIRKTTFQTVKTYKNTQKHIIPLVLNLNTPRGRPWPSHPQNLSSFWHQANGTRTLKAPPQRRRLTRERTCRAGMPFEAAATPERSPGPAGSGRGGAGAVPARGPCPPGDRGWPPPGMAGPPEVRGAVGMAGPPEMEVSLSRGFSEEQFRAACRELDQPAGPWELLVESSGVRVYRLCHEVGGLRRRGPGNGGGGRGCRFPTQAWVWFLQAPRKQLSR